VQSATHSKFKFKHLLAQHPRPAVSCLALPTAAPATSTSHHCSHPSASASASTPQTSTNAALVIAGWFLVAGVCYRCGIIREYREIALLKQSLLRHMIRLSIRLGCVRYKRAVIIIKINI
jgi:hypothetical protein